MICRPWRVPEWVWAVAGAATLVLLGLVSPAQAWRAAGRGGDVYLFLAGMMLLAELARREGVFVWIAEAAAQAARGSRVRLFALVYTAGVAVTVVLSNDATAVVLTPAVAAAARDAKVAPLPYLYACAFVANAASFVLPISNPANFVVFGNGLPPLGRWLAAFSLPSLLSIAATYAVLAWLCRADLRGDARRATRARRLSGAGRAALYGIAATALALILASALGARLGQLTFVAAAIVLGIVTAFDRAAPSHVLRSVSWGVLALVAGLFVLVRGLEATGVLELARRATDAAANWPHCGGPFAAAFAAALFSNVANNLPSGLIAGTAISHLALHDVLKNATAIGIDLGPNLSVTGSLATILWLVALRRERIDIDAMAFLRVGACVMPPALALAVAALCLGAR